MAVADARFSHRTTRIAPIPKPQARDAPRIARRRTLARVDVVFAALQHVLAHPHVRADAHDPRRRTHDALAHSSADAFLPGVRMRRRAN
ncbi:hypothetical protein [Burkholderia sp. ABCPW 14]|uniref:hypothetical protein n=1 Tax=Burkholderia sp. ABCPW 14 TaxID=1637860 RepID=UPI0012E39F59|nr:hypothetical protein [Burkholderia sp. ABCPW 14]